MSREVNGRILFLLLFSVAAIPMVFAGLSGPTPIPNPPNFYINSSVAVLCKGQAAEVPVTVTNAGTVVPSPGSLMNMTGIPMQDIALSLSDSKYSSTLGNSTVYIDKLVPHSSQTVYFPVFVNANASLFISSSVSISYYYYGYYSDVETRNLTFETESCPNALSINSMPAVLNAGYSQHVIIRLTNLANYSLSSGSVSVSMPSSDGAILGNKTFSDLLIAPHSSISINETVFVSRNASSIVPVNVSAEFSAQGTPMQVLQTLPMLSSSGINMTSSSFTVSPTQPTPGSVFSVSFILTNTGLAPASAVTAVELPLKGISAFGQNSVFIGDIGADSQTPVTMSFIAGNVLKPGKYQIPIMIKYLNSLRQQQVSWANYTLEINKSQNSSAFAGASSFRARGSSAAGAGARIAIDAILAIIAIAFAVLFFRERKNNKGKQR